MNDYGIGRVPVDVDQTTEDLAQLEAVKMNRLPQPDYPNGRRLSCGCTVYYRHEVMSASLGSSCPDCFDRMSDC